jgi:hypothetical protein
MKHNYFLLQSNRAEGSSNRHEWTVPYQNLQYQPNMKVKILGASCVNTAANAYKLIALKLCNRSINSTSSDNTSNSLVGFLTLQNLSGNVSFKMDESNVEVIMKSNPLVWQFKLYDESDTIIPYANITNLNIIIEVEYLENEERKKKVIELMN